MVLKVGDTVTVKSIKECYDMSCMLRARGIKNVYGFVDTMESSSGRKFKIIEIEKTYDRDIYALDDDTDCMYEQEFFKLQSFREQVEQRLKND